MDHDLFISYQWDVQKQVRKLNDFLTSKNYNVWMDVHQLSAGSSCLHSQLASSIKCSKAVICCITSKYVKSNNCYLELNWTNECGKKLIVLMFEDLKVSELDRVGFIISPQLRINLFEDKQVIETWQGPKFDELLRAIDNSIGKGSQHLRTLSPLSSQVQLAVSVEKSPEFSKENANCLPIIVKTNIELSVTDLDKQKSLNSKLTVAKNEYQPIIREVSPFRSQIQKSSAPKQDCNVFIEKLDRKSPGPSLITHKSIVIFFNLQSNKNFNLSLFLFKGAWQACASKC
jgi:hypothetical protein